MRHCHVATSSASGESSMGTSLGSGTSSACNRASRRVSAFARSSSISAWSFAFRDSSKTGGDAVRKNDSPLSLPLPPCQRLSMEALAAETPFYGLRREGLRERRETGGRIVRTECGVHEHLVHELMVATIPRQGERSC